VLEHSIRREQVPEEVEKRHLEFIKAELVPRYAEFIGHEIQKAYLRIRRKRLFGDERQGKACQRLAGCLE
jgi:predicted Ser/Thr protein kinase